MRSLFTRSGRINDTNICSMVDEAIFLDRTGGNSAPVIRILTEECTPRFGAKNTGRVLKVIAQA